MLGSPPSGAAALPSFSFLDHDGSHRAASDTDFLPAWSKTLSPSPGLLPTIIPDLSTTTPSLANGSGSGNVDVPTGSTSTSASVATTSRSTTRKGASKSAKGKGKAPDVGNGLSPVLAATHPSALTLDPADPSLSDAVFASAHPASTFESSFSKFIDPTASAEAIATRKSPNMRRKTLSSQGGPAPLSIANVATLPSSSGSGPASASTRRASTSVTQNPSRRQSMTDEVTGQRAYAQGLPEGLQRRSTAVSSLDGAEDAPRIQPLTIRNLTDATQAYAKLEFPSFDIYIQKLSVTIGRRPASALANLPSPSVPLSLDDARNAGVSLEDYILGLSDNPPSIKKEDSLTPHELNGLSPKELDKGKGKAREVDPFAEFVRATSPSDGSKPAVEAKSAFSPALAPSKPPVPATTLTDVDLGPLRAVSRQHAKLFFDYEIGAWVLEVLGRNGVVVEGSWRAKGEKAILTKKTKIQIAERIFHFVLPTVDVVTIGGDVETPAAATSTIAPAAKRKDSSGARSASLQVGENGDGAVSSSSLSEVSDSDTEVTAVRAKSLHGNKASSRDLSETPAPQPVTMPPTTINPEALTAPMPSASAASKVPTPRKAPPAVPTAASYRPIRSSTKRQVSPPPPPPSAKSTAPAASVGNEDDVEDAHTRAEMVAQILSGRMPAGTGRETLVRAAAEAQRRAGKGKAPVRPVGKAPGKGKGLPPRSRRPSDALQWSEHDVFDFSDSDSDSSGDSDIDEDLVQAATEVMDMDVVKNRFGGGKMLAVRKASSASPAPAHMPAKTPRHGGKMPAKQPRQRPNPPPATPAALPPASFTSVPASLPSVLPALPAFALSPANGSPALLPPAALPSLPPLPPLKPATPSPAATSGGGAQAKGVAGTGTSAAAVPPKKPKSHKKKAKTEIVGTSAAASSLKPNGTPSVASAAGAAGGVDQKSGTASTGGKADDKAKDGKGKGDAPAKPRPSPYTPAPLPENGIMPDEAPPDNPNAKPPYTYASLIAQAIHRSEQKKMSLHEIYDWVKSGWQNSIRHNLTPARGFLKGSFWEIDPAQMSNFDGHHFRKKADGPTGAAAAAATASASSSAGGAPSTSAAIATAIVPAYAGKKPKSHAIPQSAANATAAPTAAATPAPTAAAAARPPASTTSSSSSHRTGPPGPGQGGGGGAILSKPLPLVIKPIPASYVRPPPPLTAQLLADPPIVMHEGELILNPTIFATLPKETLDALRKLPAGKALPTLQAHVVQHLKDQLKKKGMPKPSRPSPPVAPSASTSKHHGGGGTKRARESEGGSVAAGGGGAAAAAAASGAEPGAVHSTSAKSSAPPAKSAKHKKGSHASSSAAAAAAAAAASASVKPS
ncbi:hypothetical protein RHOSPDRAFT_28200 [Rhodotorula sp. JG-1b]|nr:hypothetical protein RHOSPDRAFT_28200 [Rhodotorula sp. JG-1b]